MTGGYLGETVDSGRPVQESLLKRAFDLLASVAALIVLSPLLLLIACLIKLDSRGPVIFCQDRVGRGFRTFRIYKFRTMTPDAPMKGGPLTSAGDPRVTRLGRFLRRNKLDELPQLLNVVRGEMSLVGPRPEIPRYVELFRRDYEQILRVRPGITDIASVQYRDESRILGQSADVEQVYLTKVLPHKIQLGKEYVRNASVGFDLSLILRTLARIWGPGDGNRLS